MNGVLRSTRINWIFLQRPPIHNNLKSYTIEKTQNKAKYLTRNSKRQLIERTRNHAGNHAKDSIS